MSKTYMQKYGIWLYILRQFNRLFGKLERVFMAKHLNKKEKKTKEAKLKEPDFFKNIMNDKKYDKIFVFYPYTEWDLPIFQRPQQIALELTKNENILYIYCTTNRDFDEVYYYQKIKENLIVTTEFEEVMKAKSDKVILHLYSTDTRSNLNYLKESLNNGTKIMYEYIDEIHYDITHNVSDEYLEKHNFLMKDERVKLVTTADKLYEDAKLVRSKNFVLATNGVNPDDFKYENMAIPSKMNKIIRKYKKVIGYYGALAKWFDYELINKLAKKHKDYAIVLIGHNYDFSIYQSKILNNSNVFYLGKVNYYKLIDYSKHFDLLTIPFLINDITESTSPIKLFEYMAIKKPILTTDLRECRKYKSAIIGKDHDDFLNKVDYAINLINDDKYIKLEEKEADENSWKNKCNEILTLID